MTSGSKTTNPITGTRFIYTPKYSLIKDFRGYYWHTPRAEAGVWIEYRDGVRIWRPNSYYEHIEPLKPLPKDII